MYLMKVEIEKGTLDIKEYDLKKKEFIGSDDKVYKMDEIKYFIFPAREMKKILGENEEEKKEEVSKVEIKETKPRNHSK